MPAVRDSRGRFIKGSGSSGGGQVKDIDKGYKAMMDRLHSRAAELTVGIHAAEGEAPKEGEGDLTVVEVATFHEFGIGVDRRSFIADWHDENEAKHKAQIRQMGEAILKGKVESVEQGLARLGALYQGEVQRRIAENIPPPLKESTIKRKGSSVALIDTGQMRSAITHLVKTK